MMEDAVHKHVHDGIVINGLMADLIKIVGEYAVTEIKELNLRTNSILKSAVEKKEEEDGPRGN